MNIEHIKQALNETYTDLLMLEDDSWQPESSSIGATIDNIILIADELGLTVEDTRE